MRNPIVLVAFLALISLATHADAQAAPPAGAAAPAVPVPELDPKNGASAMVLIAGATAVFAGRRRTAV